MLKLKCLYHHVLVRVDLPEQKLESGLIIPDSVAKDKTRHTGVVEHVGTGVLDKMTGEITPLMTKPGDRVMFGQFSGMKILINGVEYKHMREDEIIAIIEESDEPIKVEDDEY